ncbi:Lsr2 dimerization domain-containing protein [Microbispora hainanensis]|uniref:Lsr2 family protein n=1 Tax=Microbispora hainanensis TaxID=568844 RepID=A0ABZ1SVZ7_9ACTN|nr:histone-like nucleoid-structuring protein Lsr2 [Microbispora hainanensis]
MVPQYEVNGRRIDLVVSGAQGRLAVECDGDHWHGAPEQLENDLDRERELKRAGWQFWRVRESEFYFDQEAALEPLWAELDRRGIRPGEVGTEGEPQQDENWIAVTLSEQDGLDGLDDGDSLDLEEITLAVPPKPHPGVTDPGPVTARMTATTPSSSHIRAWARQHGYAVSDRGRLSEDVLEAYHRAHQPE